MEKKHWLWGKKQKNEDMDSQFFITDFTNQAYTKAWQVAREKRKEMLEQLGKDPFILRETPYNILQYVGKICWSLRELVADMAGIGKEFLSVSLFYKLETGPDEKWKQITENGECITADLEEYMKQKGTVFYRLLNEGRPYIYILDKPKSILRGEYRPDQRDAMFDNEGSVLGMKMDFENIGKTYVQGILVISVYGRDFIAVDNSCRRWGKCFEYVMAYDILPYFRQLFQTELGMLYMETVKKDDERR